MSRDRDLRFPNRDGLRLLFPFDYRQGKYAFQSRDWGTVSIIFTLDIWRWMACWGYVHLEMCGYISVMWVHVYCIQVNYFKTVVPFRRSANYTSHCYSELSVGYWDIVCLTPFPLFFSGDHAQAQGSGKGYRLWMLVGCILPMSFRLAFASALLLL